MPHPRLGHIDGAAELKYPPESRFANEIMQAPNRDFQDLPKDLPVPVDDGGARHLAGLRLPDLLLAATDGSRVNLARLPGRSVIFAYPRTGEPGKPSPDGWDEIPGARGCTPQSCGFRDHYEELKKFGVARVFGLSTQDTDYQREAVERLHLPFAMLSDARLKLRLAIKLPTFEVAGMTLFKRLALVIDDGIITKVFYPVFPPDKNAEQVIAWLQLGRNRRAPPRIPRETLSASARRYSCCSASSGSYRKA